MSVRGCKDEYFLRLRDQALLKEQLLDPCQPTDANCDPDREISVLTRLITQSSSID
jgi:hypothetical protein